MVDETMPFHILSVCTSAQATTVATRWNVTVFTCVFNHEQTDSMTKLQSVYFLMGVLERTSVLEAMTIRQFSQVIVDEDLPRRACRTTSRSVCKHALMKMEAICLM